MGAEQGYWNGLPTPVRKITGTVREWVEGDPPQAWWKPIVGQRVRAVEVVLDNVNFGGGIAHLYDEDGSGWHKVTEGHGSPRWGHRDVPLVDVQPRENGHAIAPTEPDENGSESEARS